MTALDQQVNQFGIGRQPQYRLIDVNRGKVVDTMSLSDHKFSAVHGLCVVP